MSEQPAWRVGQRVCVIGVGMDQLVHEHRVVTQLTKLYVISVKSGSTTTRRHRLRDSRSPGGPSYGGTTIHPTCQRPKTGK